MDDMRDDECAPQEGFSSGQNCSGYCSCEEPVSSSSSGGSTSSSDHTLVVHLHQKNVQVAIFSDEKGPLPVEDEFGESNIRFLIGVIKEKSFAYGRAVENLSTRASDNPNFHKCWVSWELGGLLLSEEPKRTRLIYFNEGPVSAPDEFLLGMFLKYLAHLADSCCRRRFNDMDVNLENVVFPVPPWFSSVARQMLKDAAQVAGFKNSFVVHDTTLLAYLHLESLNNNDFKPSKTRSGRHMISIVENYGHVTMACYSGSWNNFLQAEAYTSTQTEAAKFDRTVRKKQFKLNCSSEVNPEERIVEHRKVIIQSLFCELIEKLTIGVTREDTDVLLLCTDTKWESQVSDLIKCITYRHFGMGPVKDPDRELATSSDDGRVLLFSHLTSPMIRDRLPLPIFRSSNALAVKFKKIWEGEQGLGNGRDVQVEAIIPYHDYNSILYQKSINSAPPFGIIDIRQWLFFKYSNVKVTFVISPEGIIRLDRVEAFTDHGKETMERNNEYKWRSYNLSQAELLQVAKNVEVVYDSSCQYLKSVEILKAELWRLSTKISEMQWNINYKVKPTTRVKYAIWDEVEKITEYLTSTNELPLLDKNYLVSSLAKVKGYYSSYFI